MGIHRLLPGSWPSLSPGSLRRLCASLSALLCAASLLLSAAPAQAQTSAATAEALMRESGLWTHLTGIGPQVRESFVAGMARFDPAIGADEVVRLSAVIEQAFAPDRLRAQARATFEQGTDPRHLPALQRWFASPTGRTVTRLEEAAAASQTDTRGILQQGGRLFGGLPAERQALLEELVLVTRSPESMVRMTLNTALAVYRGIASVRPDPNGPTEDDLRAAFEAQRPQLQQAFMALALASFSMAYAELPTGELARYVGFLKDEPGQHFTGLSQRALDAAMADATQEMARRMVLPPGQTRT